jgi:hypothetical protein
MKTVEWQDRCERLLDLLVAYSGGDRVFNQYRESQPGLDLPEGAEARCHNLGSYLEAFAGSRFILVGEAAGYAGCRFSGIPFTCEAQLAGPERLSWTRDLPLSRSSTARAPWVERSATMVWEALGERRDFLLWNAFPWHPFGARGLLSNRHPGSALGEGLAALRCLLSLFPAARPVAVGRVAQKALVGLSIEAPYVRHPSHGGKREFVAGVRALLDGTICE